MIRSMASAEKSSAVVLKGPLKVAPKKIFVANGREFFSSIDKYVPEAHKDEFVQTDKDETDPMIFELGDDKLMFVPQSIDAEYIEDIAKLFGFNNLSIVQLKESGNGLSKDILSDKETYEMLKRTILGDPEIEVIPWGNTPQFQELHGSLRQQGLIFKAPETPLENSEWHPDYANTKVGTREILKRVQVTHPELGMNIPEGFPCSDIDVALQVAKYFVGSGRGLVLKANLGAAGIGVFVFSPKEYDLTTPDGWKAMESKVHENGLLQNGPIVVEEYIEPDFNQRGVFPSVDSLVKPDGTVQIQAVSGMAIHRNGEEVEFYGSTIGHGLFTKEQSDYMSKINRAVGEEHGKIGYRGWYDTDFILSTDGKLYLTETNVRRTGTSYMVALAEHLFGLDWEDQMAMIANDKYIRPHLAGLSHKNLKVILSELLYPMSGEKRGVVLTQSMRTMFGRGKFAYASIGKDQEDAELIEKQLEDILG